MAGFSPLEVTANDAWAIRDARHSFSRWLTAGGGGDDDDVDDAVLVFDELVTNAVRHAGGARRARATCDDGLLRIEVSDDSPKPAVRCEGLGGRGLWIVEQLVRDWGWTRAGVGKMVWAEIAWEPRPRLRLVPG